MLETISKLLQNNAVQCLIIVIVAILLVRLLKMSIRRAIRKSTTTRSETLVRVLGKLVAFIIYFFGILQIMEILFHVQPSSLLAATGIVSVAFGFGAQSLVKDIISGFFILFENQIAVSDLVTIENFTGTVEEMTLRTTIIKNIQGDLFTIPNGSITKVLNHSRCERGVMIELSVAYESDLNVVIRTLETATLCAQKEMPSIHGVPEILGVSALAESAVKIKILAKCEIGEQFAVERELLRRIKSALDESGIKIPYPQVMISERKGE